MKWLTPNKFLLTAGAMDRMLLSKGFNQESGTKISKAIDVPLNIVNIQERMEQRSDITMGRIPSRKRNIIKEAARRPTGMLSELPNISQALVMHYTCFLYSACLTEL